MSNIKVSWKLALFPVFVVSFFALYPQLTLLMSAGGWKGSYYVSNYDEVAYSSYVNALVKGEPRKSDPYVTGNADYESLYSVQFIPAYSIAVPARMLGLSTSTAFIFLALAIAIASTFALFFLIRALTEDDLIACAGTLVVLCFGTAVSFQGELRNWLGQQVLVDYLPFLRRYQPGFGFPLLFVFCLLVLKSLNSGELKRRILHSVGAAFVFAVLVFTYFYLWTAAAAWLFCLVILTFIAQRDLISKLAYTVAPIAVIGAGAVIPYFRMLLERSSNLDSVQLLANTHQPILLSPTLIIGILIAAGFAFFAMRERVVTSDQRLVIGSSFALTPVILFNQQILTGRSLQPAHYEIFIANYMVLVAAALLGSLFIRSTRKDVDSRRLLAYVAAAAVIWGFVEVTGSSRRNALAAEIRDNSMPALQFIDTDSKASDVRPVVHATNFVTADLIPTAANACPLWNAHTTSAGGVSLEQNKRLFYLYLYYSGFDDKELADALDRHKFEVVAAIFGSDRALPALGHEARSITSSDIRAEVEAYSGFTRSVEAATAYQPLLSYIIVPAEGENNFANLDKWYIRDEGHNTGMFTVYRLTKRGL